MLDAGEKYSRSCAEREVGKDLHEMRSVGDVNLLGKGIDSITNTFSSPKIRRYGRGIALNRPTAEPDQCRRASWN